nr:recombinase family protein [Rhizobium ruizarguesonis]
MSRDVEHSAKILKELRCRDVELWTVHAGTPVTDLELAMRAALSHEMVEQIRYRTREGMKTAVRKGTRDKLVLELAGTDAPVEDFQEKIAKLKQQFNPANVEVAIASCCSSPATMATNTPNSV